MSPTPDDLARQIAELEADLAHVRSDRARAAIEADIAALREQRAALLHIGPGAQTGDVTTGDNAGRDVRKDVRGRVDVSGKADVAVGVNPGTIQLFFGATPPPDAKSLLDSYLNHLIADHGYLRLGKLLDRERSGRDQAVLPEIELLRVYTSLTTDVLLPVEPFELSRDDLKAALKAGDPEQVLPEHVRLPMLAQIRPDGHPGQREDSPRPRSLGDRPLSTVWQEVHGNLGDRRRGSLMGHWYKPETLINALAPLRSRVVLLGSPGSGKSTGLRHLTVYIATALLSGKKTLRIPFFCPLGPVAEDLGDDPRQDRDTLVAALLRPVLGAGALREGLRAQVVTAITNGNAFLLFDGLDEVPGVPEPTAAGMLSRRERIADAIRAFAREVGSAPVVVTCRTRPYEQDASWQLREGWAVRRLQPFAFGQIRAFITRWYAATCRDGQGRYQSAEAAERAKRLIALLGQPDRQTLRDLAATPLLLTMLVLLDYNNTRMPEKRVDVYEELVKLLLDRWEGVRSSDVDRRPQRIGERLGLKHLTVDDLRPALHELAFTAHRQQVDGRGVLTGALLRETLDAFFARKLNPANPKAVLAEAAHPREKLMRLLLEESGLLLEEADETYVLPHLTFEEYLAACHLAGRDSQGIALAYAQWATGGERWREVVHLLMGRLLRQEKYDNLFTWLQRLVSPRNGDGSKLPLRRQRDLLLAADCYATIEQRTAFSGTFHDVVAFEETLRTALVELLAHPDPGLVLTERIEAAEALADLGDPRFPLEPARWAHELRQRNEQFGAPAGYFCYVPSGRYLVGGWPEQEKDATEGLVGKLQSAVRRLTNNGAHVTLQAFWIARLPITVAQYAPFVEQGYGPDAERWWTPNGWKWKLEYNRRAPYAWGRAPYNGANQPVIGVTWYEATAYCAWLTEQVRAALPAGYVIRLPTEAEWETAASFDGTSERRPYPWGDAEPTTELAIYDAAKLNAAAPVGSCPAGAAACGALDMGGNVWEHTTNNHADYPGQSTTGAKDFTPDDYNVSLCGGSYYRSSTFVRCGARGRILPVDDDFLDVNFGFRIVVAPPLAH
jgi:formylglycine-generating enzyme required for sulfatase activity